MNNCKSNSSLSWLVPYLGKKVRQLRREENTFRKRISELSFKVLSLQYDLNKERQDAETIANLWKSQSDHYFNELIAAHKTIGGLKYLLESHGIEIPEYLK